MSRQASEGEGLSDVSETASGRVVEPKDERLEQIAHMADLLADRVLNAQIMGRSVPDSDVLALLEASLLLNEHGRETSPLLEQVVRRLDAATTGDDAEASDEEEQQDIERLARSLRPLRGGKDR